MSNRIFLLIVAVMGAGANDAFAQATSVMLQLFPFTGEIRILNDNPLPFGFISYRLDSPSGALNGSNGVWKSIEDTYDASGNGFIDANEWVEFTPNAGTHATNLSEGALADPGGVLPAQRSLSLGKIWDPSLVATPDVTVQIGLPDGSDATVIVRRAIDGDYIRDRVVDELDYSYWSAVFGSTSDGFLADGNIDGIVNAADYTVWRNNLGVSLPASGDGGVEIGSAASSASAVPEPAGMLLGLLAGCGCLLFGLVRRGHSIS